MKQVQLGFVLFACALLITWVVIVALRIVPQVFQALHAVLRKGAIPMHQTHHETHVTKNEQQPAQHRTGGQPSQAPRRDHPYRPGWAGTAGTRAVPDHPAAYCHRGVSSPERSRAPGSSTPCTRAAGYPGAHSCDQRGNRRETRGTRAAPSRRGRSGRATSTTVESLAGPGA